MIIVGLGIILGLVLGSFVKCLADRSVTDISFWGRSYCDRCAHQLRWYDLFPIFSYLSTRGKCRYCHHQIEINHPLTEALTGLLVGLLFYLQFPLILSPLLLTTFAIDLVLLCLMIATLLTDIKTGLIPDRLTFPGFWVILTLLVLSTGFALTTLPLPIAVQPLISGLGAALLMAIFFGGIIIITKGQGMGGGDLKLAIVMGLGLGLPDILTALMIAFISGSIVGLGLLALRQKSFRQTIPFGPFLSFGTIITIFWGDQLLNWYLNLSF